MIDQSLAHRKIALFDRPRPFPWTMHWLRENGWAEWPEDGQ